MGAFCHEPRAAAQGISRLASRPFNLPRKPTCMASFALFPHLPPELRLKIWTLNLPTLRLVSISSGTEAGCDSDAGLFAGCTSNAPIPANLHVCAEARANALERFRYVFGFVRLPGRVLYNPDSDILHFGPRDGYMASVAQFNTCMTMCDPAQLALVRRIAISDALFWAGSSYHSMSAARLTVDVLSSMTEHMPALQQVFFIPGEEDEPHEAAQTEERMARQIQMAIDTLCRHRPDWKPPPWTIITLQTLLGACG